MGYEIITELEKLRTAIVLAERLRCEPDACIYGLCEAIKAHMDEGLIDDLVTLIDPETLRAIAGCAVQDVLGGAQTLLPVLSLISQKPDIYQNTLTDEIVSAALLVQMVSAKLEDMDFLASVLLISGQDKWNDSVRRGLTQGLKLLSSDVLSSLKNGYFGVCVQHLSSPHQALLNIQLFSIPMMDQCLRESLTSMSQFHRLQYAPCIIEDIKNYHPGVVSWLQSTLTTESRNRLVHG